MGDSTMQSGFAMAGGQWYHAAIVWGKSEKDERLTSTRLYIDGVLLGSTSQSTLSLGDWTGKCIRIGSAVPLDIRGLRVWDVARYSEDFDPGSFGRPDEHALVQLGFDGALPACAKVR